MLTARELVLEIEKFPPSDRIRIVDEIIRDVMKPDSEIDRIWAEEAERRLSAFRTGQNSTISYRIHP